LFEALKEIETNCFIKLTGKSAKLKCSEFLHKEIAKLRCGEKNSILH